MLLNTASLTIPPTFAGKDDARYILNGVRITPTETVATDGHRLCILTHRPGFTPEEFPAVGQHEPPAPLAQPVTVTADDLRAVGEALKASLRALKKAKGRGAARFPVLQHAYLDAGAVNGHVPFYVTDGQTPRTFAPKPMEGTFPDWGRVLPSEPPHAVVRLNAAYLRDAAQAALDLCGKEAPASVTVELRGELAPVVFRAEHEGQTLTLLTMPVAPMTPKGR